MDEISKKIFNFITGLSPLIIASLWFVNVSVITNQNNVTITELKTEIKEMRCDMQNMSRELEAVKTTIKLKVR